MTRGALIVTAVALALAGAASLAAAKPMSYDLPPETMALKPGPGLDAAQANCLSCHSADYILTQPRGAKFGRDFWQAEVTKMIKVYGASINEGDAKIIVDYLAQTY